MVSSVTLKRYISQLDEVILAGDVSAAQYQVFHKLLKVSRKEFP